ncbi:hypothetical protein EJB05_03898, partial [Eragrostis curvula]
MNPGNETAPTRSAPTERRAHSTSLPPDHRQAMDAGNEVTSPDPSQSTEDIERQAKSEPSRRVVMGRRRLPPEDWRVPDRFRSDGVTKTNYPMDEEDLALVERARVISQLFRDPAHRAKLAIGVKKDDKVLSEKTGEEQRGAGHLQHAEELKPPCKEYATPNLKNAGNFSESPSLPEQALSCSKNREMEYCMSDEFIDKLDKKAKLYFSKMKQHSEEEIIENGRQFMKDEAFAAYRYYIADNDLFEAFDYQVGELLHHCFTVEEYAKVYHHYNFTIKTKANDQNDWTSTLFFLLKLSCCTVSSPCYSCEKHHATELQHPSGGGYAGHSHRDLGSSCLSAESFTDDECGMWHIVCPQRLNPFAFFVMRCVKADCQDSGNMIKLSSVKRNLGAGAWRSSLQVKLRINVPDTTK